MEYVMVPVPEEIADQVLRFLEYKGRLGTARPQRTPTADLDHGTDEIVEPMSRIFRDLDPNSRSLLAIVSRATLAGEKVTVSEAAHRMGLTERETLGTMLEVNYLITEQGGPPLAILTEDAPDQSPDRPVWDQRFLVTRNEVAEPVIAVAGDDDGDGLAFLEADDDGEG